MLVLATTVGIKAQPPDSGSQEIRALDILASIDVHWLCINDITGSSHNWVTTHASKSPHWFMHNIFMDTRSAQIFDSMHGSTQRCIVPLDCIENDLRSHPSMHLIDIHYI